MHDLYMMCCHCVGGASQPNKTCWYNHTEMVGNAKCIALSNQDALMTGGCPPDPLMSNICTL